MALRIGKFAGNGPRLWLRMQQAYGLWHREFRYGSSSRSFRLPTGIDEEKLDATFKAGVLTGLMPKKENGKSTRIDIE